MLDGLDATECLELWASRLLAARGNKSISLKVKTSHQ